MDDLRAVLAIIIFAISSYFVFDLFAYGFSWPVLAVSIVGFLLAHFIWPPKHSGDSAWYDMLEIIVDFPYRCLAVFIRGVGKLVKHGDIDL